VEEVAAQKLKSIVDAARIIERKTRVGNWMMGRLRTVNEQNGTRSKICTHIPHVFPLDFSSTLLRIPHGCPQNDNFR